MPPEKLTHIVEKYAYTQGGFTGRISARTGIAKVWNRFLTTITNMKFIEGAAHNANDDQPEQVNELLHTFLQAL